jgi:molybdopterin-guanine dinucleotide biosynthesis protein A
MRDNLIDIPCVILAGGKSSRMGEDKSLLPFGEFDSLSEYQYRRLKSIFKNVYISTKSRDKFNFEANFIEDTKSSNESAPTVALKSIFEYLNCDSFFVITVDTPFLELDTIKYFIEFTLKHQDKDLIAIESSKVDVLCALYRKGLKSEIDNMVKNSKHKLQILFKSCSSTTFRVSENELMNLNYRDDYSKALEKLSNK